MGAEDGSSQIRIGVTSPKGMKRSAFTALMGKLENNHFHYGHLPYSIEMAEIFTQMSIKLVVLARDPRAVVCSNVHFILKHKHHQLFEIFRSLPDLESQIKLAIKGFEKTKQTNNQELLSIDTCYKSIIDWATYTDSPLILFEDLIGSQGGGNQELQQHTINKLINYIGCELSSEQVDAISKQLFSETSPTFYRGTIDGWREDFSPNLEEYFNIHAKQSLIDFKKLFEENSRYRSK
jgi:hypothetical protein